MLVCKTERKLLRSFSLLLLKQTAKVTCNPRLGELRDYGYLAQGQLSQTSERRKVNYDFLMKTTPDYQSILSTWVRHSLPRPSGGKDCPTFPFWPREVREGDINWPR